MTAKALMLTLMSAVVATATVATPTAVSAQPYGYEQGYRDGGAYQTVRHYRDADYRDGRRGYGNRGYDDRGYNGRRNSRYNDGRCRDKGTGGTIIGAIAGGLLGNAVVGRRGDNTAGTIVGAGVGVSVSFELWELHAARIVRMAAVANRRDRERDTIVHPSSHPRSFT